MGIKLNLEKMDFDALLNASKEIIERNNIFNQFLNKNRPLIEADFKTFSDIESFNHLDLSNLPDVLEKILKFIKEEKITELGIFLKESIRYFSLFLKEHFSHFNKELAGDIGNILREIDQEFEEIPSSLNLPLNLPNEKLLPKKMQKEHGNESQAKWSKIILNDPARTEKDVSFFSTVFNKSNVSSVRVQLILDEINLKNLQEALCYASCDFHPVGNLHADHFQSSSNIIIRQNEMLKAMNLNVKFCERILKQAGDKGYFLRTVSLGILDEKTKLGKNIVYIKEHEKKCSKVVMCSSKNVPKNREESVLYINEDCTKFITIKDSKWKNIPKTKGNEKKNQETGLSIKQPLVRDKDLKSAKAVDMITTLCSFAEKDLEYQYLLSSGEQKNGTLQYEKMSKKLQDMISKKVKKTDAQSFLKRLANMQNIFLEDLRKNDTSFPDEKDFGAIFGTKLFFMEYHNCIDNIWLITAAENSGSGKRDIHPIKWLEENKYNSPALKTLGTISKKCILYTVNDNSEVLCAALKKWFREKYDNIINFKNYQLNKFNKPITVQLEKISFEEIPDNLEEKEIKKLKNKKKKKEIVFSIKLITASKIMNTEHDFENSSPSQSLDFSQSNFPLLEEIVVKNISFKNFNFIILPYKIENIEIFFSQILVEGNIFLRKTEDDKIVCTFKNTKNELVDSLVLEEVKAPVNFTLEELEKLRTNILSELDKNGHISLNGGNKDMNFGENLVKSTLEEYNNEQKKRKFEKK